MNSLDKFIFPNGREDWEYYKTLKEKYNYSPPKPFRQRNFKKPGFFKSKK